MVKIGSSFPQAEILEVFQAHYTASVDCIILPLYRSLVNDSKPLICWGFIYRKPDRILFVLLKLPTVYFNGTDFAA